MAPYKSYTPAARRGYSAGSGSSGGGRPVNNPATGTGTQFIGGYLDDGTPIYGYAEAGDTVTRGGIGSGGSQIVSGTSGGYIPGTSESGTIETSEGKKVEVNASEMRQEARKEREKLLNNTYNLTEAQRAELKANQEEKFRRAYPDKEQPQEPKKYSGSYGSIVNAEVSLSPELAKIYARDVLKQSIPINENEPTVLGVKTDLNTGNTYEVKQPVSQDPSAIFNPPIKETARDKFITQKETAEAIKEEPGIKNKIFGGVLSASTDVFKTVYNQAGQFFSQNYADNNKKYFDALGNPVMTEGDKGLVPVAEAVEYRQAETGNKILLGTLGAGITTIKPNPFSVEGEPLPSNKLLKKFDKSYSQEFTIKPTGKSFEGKNVFSSENLQLGENKIINQNKILSEKLSIRYQTFNEKINYLSPSNTKGLQVSGIGINNEQISAATSKGLLNNYQKISYTNEGGITNTEFYRINKITGKTKLVGALQNQPSTPSILYTEPKLGNVNNEIRGENQISSVDYQTSSQKGISNSAERFTIKGNVRTEALTTTTTKATSLGTRTYSRTDLNSYEGMPLTKLEIDKVNFNYGGAVTQNDLNIFMKSKNGILKTDSITPVVSETSQISVAKQTGNIFVEKQPNLFQKILNAKIVYKPSPAERTWATIRIGNPPKLEPYGPYSSMRNDVFNAEKTYRIKIGKINYLKPTNAESSSPAASSNIIINEQKNTNPLSPFSRASLSNRGYTLGDNNAELDIVTRNININKPSTPNFNFGETRIYSPKNPTIQSPTPIVYNNFNQENNNVIKQNPIFSNPNKSNNSEINVTRESFFIKSEDKTESLSDIKIFSDNKQPTRGDSRIINIDITKPATESSQIQNTIPQQIQQSRTTQLFKPLQINRTVNIRTPEEIRPPPSKPPGIPQSNIFSGGEGFNVFVKQKGIFKQINNEPFIKSEAINFGAGFVGRNAAASFKIVESGTEAKPKKGMFDSASLSNFYSKGNVFIEKNTFRINTPGELQQITYKGIAASKNKARGFFV